MTRAGADWCLGHSLVQKICCTAVQSKAAHCVHDIVAASGQCALQCKAVHLYCIIIVMNINELVGGYVISSCCSLCKTEIELAW